MKVQITTTINAPTEHVWKAICFYDSVESFNPMVTSSTITGIDSVSTSNPS